MKGRYRSVIVREIKKEILDEFINAAIEFTTHPMDLCEPRFLNLLEKALSVAEEAISENNSISKNAQVVDAMIRMAEVAVCEPIDGMPEKHLTPQTSGRMRLEKLLLASLDTESCLSGVEGLINSALLIAQENGNADKLAIFRDGDKFRPRER
ncbi:MAG: hypothetical protein WC464_01225, partial [Bdellovibrionales bacterium]